MNPDAQQLWRAPPWALAVLLATLGMLGPFSIDTYIPTCSGIAASLHATPVQMQQTLSAYLFGFFCMSLFHGALSASGGVRPVVCWGVARGGMWGMVGGSGHGPAGGLLGGCDNLGSSSPQTLRLQCE